jgi:hypothetical protein
MFLIFSGHKMTSKVDATLLCCPSCMTNNKVDRAKNVAGHKSFSWALHLLCRTCNEVWHVCIDCEIKTSRYINDTQLYRHNYTYHRGTLQSDDGEVIEVAADKQNVFQTQQKSAIHMCSAILAVPCTSRRRC